MRLIAQASERFVDTNKVDANHQHELAFGEGVLKGVHPMYELPHRPFAISGNAYFYTDGAGRLLMKNEKNNLQYFDVMAAVPPAPLLIRKNGSTFVYDDIDLEAVRSLINAEMYSISDESLGKLLVPVAFWRGLRLAIKVLSGRGIEKTYARTDTIFAKVCAHRNGKPLLKIDRCGQYIDQFGGFREMTFNADGGYLGRKVALEIDFDQFSEIAKISNFGRSKVNIEIFRARFNAKQAVLKWYCENWTGYFITQAKIK